MMTFAERLRESRRLCILRLLDASPGFESNHLVLHEAVADAGLPASFGAIQADLEWLDGAGLLRLEKIAGNGLEIWLARLTPAGADTARGLLRVSGVCRTFPGEL